MSSTLATRLKVNRTLVTLSALSVERMTALLAAFEDSSISTTRSTAVSTIDAIVNETANLLLLGEVDEEQSLSERALNSAGRTLATAIHALALVETQAGHLSPSSTHAATVSAAIKRLENGYEDGLLDVRLASELSDAESMASVTESLQELVTGDLVLAARALGGRSSAVRSNSLRSARLANVVRRIAMLSSACFFILFRLTNSQKASGLRKVAEGRQQLLRKSPDMFAALQSLGSLNVGETVRVSARCDDVNWLEGPNGRTVINVDAGALTRLVFPHRNAIRSGVAKGSWLYVRGRLETDSDGVFLKIRPLPVVSAAADVWEDYLVTQVRNHYDLYPRSIDMTWELPDLREIGGRNDLFGRI